MTTENDLDNLEEFEAKETSHTLPVGFQLLFWGLIAWGAWYLWAFSPWSTAWTQGGEFAVAVKENGGAAGTNIFMTILFTALPTAAAIALAFLQKNRKK